MAAVGLSQGPPHHYWYVWLDKLLPKKDLRSVGFKILLDQFIAAPFFAITFFYGMGILEDKRMSECWNEFLQKFPLVYAVSWKIQRLTLDIILQKKVLYCSLIGGFGHRHNTSISYTFRLPFVFCTSTLSQLSGTFSFLGLNTRYAFSNQFILLIFNLFHCFYRINWKKKRLHRLNKIAKEFYAKNV